MAFSSSASSFSQSPRSSRRSKLSSVVRMKESPFRYAKMKFSLIKQYTGRFPFPLGSAYQKPTITPSSMNIGAECRLQSEWSESKTRSGSLVTFWLYGGEWCVWIDVSYLLGGLMIRTNWFQLPFALQGWAATRLGTRVLSWRWMGFHVFWNTTALAAALLDRFGG